MKKLLTISLISLSLTIVACGSKKVVESTYDNGNPNVVHYYKKVKGEKVLAREEIFYEKGSKKMAGAFTENQRDGVWKAWYEDGTLWSEGVYKNGKRNGPGTTYHPNGKTACCRQVWSWFLALKAWGLPILPQPATMRWWPKACSFTTVVRPIRA